MVSKLTFLRAYGRACHSGGTDYCYGDGESEARALANLNENLTLMRAGKWPEPSQYDRPDAWWHRKLSVEREAGNGA